MTRQRTPSRWRAQRTPVVAALKPSATVVDLPRDPNATGRLALEAVRRLRDTHGAITVTLTLDDGDKVTGRLWGVYKSDGNDECDRIDCICLEIPGRGVPLFDPAAVVRISIADVQLTDEDFI